MYPKTFDDLIYEFQKLPGVGAKTAERYAFTVDKASGIVDDPNTYKDGEYIFNLLVSVIGVSLKTQDLIDSMPEYKEI